MELFDLARSERRKPRHRDSQLCGDNETLMTIHHTLLPPGLIDQHQSGWVRIAEQLAAELATGR